MSPSDKFNKRFLEEAAADDEEWQNEEDEDDVEEEEEGEVEEVGKAEGEGREPEEGEDNEEEIGEARPAFCHCNALTCMCSEPSVDDSENMFADS